MPTRPASAPEISIAMMTMRLTLTPLATAADRPRPVARRSKPKRVRSEHEPVADADEDREHDEAVDVARGVRDGREAVQAADAGIGVVPMLLLPGVLDGEPVG